MKLGVLDLVPVIGGIQPEAALSQALKLAQTAEDLGYTRYWVAEHHDMEGLACSSPEVVLAYIGAQTRRIRLGSGALLLPHYKPIKVAETFNTLAALFPGRMDLGIGRAPGGSAHVSMALSGNFLENVRNLPESLKALIELLADRFQLDGQRVTARPVPLHPPEVWLLGTNQKSSAYAAEFGVGYVFGQFMSDRDAVEVLSTYRQQFEPSHLSVKPRSMIAVNIVCADTGDEARKLAGDTAERKVLAGSPRQVREQLEEWQSCYGVDDFLVVNRVPDYEKRLRSYELLAREVISKYS